MARGRRAHQRSCARPAARCWSARARSRPRSSWRGCWSRRRCRFASSMRARTATRRRSWRAPASPAASPSPPTWRDAAPTSSSRRASRNAAACTSSPPSCNDSGAHRPAAVRPLRPPGRSRQLRGDPRDRGRSRRLVPARRGAPAPHRPPAACAREIGVRGSAVARRAHALQGAARPARPGRLPRRRAGLCRPRRVGAQACGGTPPARASFSLPPFFGGGWEGFAAPVSARMVAVALTGSVPRRLSSTR